MGDDENRLEREVRMDRRAALQLGLLGGAGLLLLPDAAGATRGKCRPKKGYRLIEDYRGRLDPQDLVGSQAPPFYQKDINPRSPTHNRYVGPQDYKGQVVVLNLWSSFSCQPCLDDLPELQKVHQAHNDVTVLGLVADGGAGLDSREVEAVLAQLTFPLPGPYGKSPLSWRLCGEGRGYEAYSDYKKGRQDRFMSTRVADHLYGNQGWPTTFIIDKQQVVRAVHIGALSAPEWESKITPYLSLAPSK